ncbi:hypothetical protein LSM04_006192 [Trypanosoma melophagium]|uniref:uncharacterized protein n=1 Tax=Trypanosoma melophagium TaxID=715481 RepID=UPI003519E6CA|nr:hypothetical protein LSM04_006192 [Trypanosoma melophagium]
MNRPGQSNDDSTRIDNGHNNSRYNDSSVSPLFSKDMEINEIPLSASPHINKETFQKFLRELALRGDIVLPTIPPHQRESLLQLAATTSPACRVLVDPSGTLHLRSDGANPYLQEELAAELHRLHTEGVKAARDNPLVLEWGFIDRNIHREVVTLLQLLGFDMGVFVGKPLFDGTYLYRVEVALHYLPRWEEERRKLIDSALQGDADPFPIPLATLRNPRVMGVYRREVRPFLYEWNCKTTRCLVNISRDSEGKLPADVRALGSVFSLRHEVNANGQVFFRRWTRHLIQVFIKYAEELRRQDRKGVEATLARYNYDLDPVDAEVMTPHFGFFNYCLEERYYRKDIMELEDLARRVGYFVFAIIENGFALVAATARQNPVLSDNYKLVFPKLSGPLENRVPAVASNKDTHHHNYHHMQQQELQMNEEAHAGNRYNNNNNGIAGDRPIGNSSSSSSSSSSNSNTTSSDDNEIRRRGRDIEKDRNNILSAGAIQAGEGRIPLPALDVSGYTAELKRESPRTFSLAASALYDTIMGKLQRTLPPGWNVRCGPGEVFLLDHIRGRAHRRDSPVVSMEWAVSQRELYNVADSMQ